MSKVPEPNVWTDAEGKPLGERTDIVGRRGPLPFSLETGARAEQLYEQMRTAGASCRGISLGHFTRFPPPNPDRCGEFVGHLLQFRGKLGTGYEHKGGWLSFDLVLRRVMDEGYVPASWSMLMAFMTAGHGKLIERPDCCNVLALVEDTSPLMEPKLSLNCMSFGRGFEGRLSLSGSPPFGFTTGEMWMNVTENWVLVVEKSEAD